MMSKTAVQKRLITVPVCWGSAPDPAGRAYSAPPDPVAEIGGPTSKGRGRRGEGKREGKGRKGA